MKKIHIFILATALSGALMYFSYLPGVDILGRLLLLFSTLTHELGHAVTSLLLGGGVESVTIEWDASGLTESRVSDSRLVLALVAAGGLVGPSIAAAILFWSAQGSDAKLHLTTRIFGAGLMLTGLLVARSFWALVFTVGLGALLLVLAGRLERFQLESLVVFIGVQLGLSVFTRSSYLFTREAAPGMPSDVAQMAQALFLPFWFWGILCGLISVAVLFWGCRCYVKSH